MSKFTEEEKAQLREVQASMRSIINQIVALAYEGLDQNRRGHVFDCFNGWTPWGWWR